MHCKHEMAQKTFNYNYVPNNSVFLLHILYFLEILTFEKNHINSLRLQCTFDFFQSTSSSQECYFWWF